MKSYGVSAIDRERRRVQCSATAEMSFKHFMEYGSDEQ